MENLLNPENYLPSQLMGAALIICLIILWIALRRRAGQSVEGKLRKASCDILLDILIPDGDDSEIHVQYALLSPRGVIIVDVRDVIGHVFGSDAMEEWTVLSDRRRFTFSNPQHALYDRMAAVRRLLPDVPVEGFVAFTNRAKFTKGQPTNVIMLDQLVEELKHEKKAMPIDSLDEFYPQWDQLRNEAVVTQVGQLLQK